jgi:hypothetical protein
MAAGYFYALPVDPDVERDASDATGSRLPGQSPSARSVRSVSLVAFSPNAAHPPRTIPRWSTWSSSSFCASIGVAASGVTQRFNSGGSCPAAGRCAAPKAILRRSTSGEASSRTRAHGTAIESSRPGRSHRWQVFALDIGVGQSSHRGSSAQQQ